MEFSTINSLRVANYIRVKVETSLYWFLHLIFEDAFLILVDFTGSLSHFTPVLDFIKKPVIWFARFDWFLYEMQQFWNVFSFLSKNICLWKRFFLYEFEFIETLIR